VARPSDATIKRLFAMCHNLCAHRDCGQPLVEGGTIVGEVCHIKGEKPGAARYDPDRTDAERHAFENLICMCRKHHKIIDTEKENYSVERLLEINRRGRNLNLVIGDSVPDFRAAELTNPSVPNGGGIGSQISGRAPRCRGSLRLADVCGPI